MSENKGLIETIKQLTKQIKKMNENTIILTKQLKQITGSKIIKEKK